MTSITRGDGMKYELAYNNFGNLESIGINGKSEKLVSYVYKTGNGRLKEIAYANGDKMKVSYSSAGEIVAERWYNATETLTAHYKYVHDGEGNVVRSIDVLNLKEYNYSYEDGRIVRTAECNVILDSGGLVTKKNLVNSILYYYDALGQLLTETVNGSAVNTMTYDSYGNIRTKNGTAYTYGDSVWKDKLTKVGTKTITYDAQGNPTTYLGNTLTWEKGRQLKQLTKSDGTAVSYTYNANGIRTSKTINGTTHTYTLDGTKILSEVWGSNTLIPLYDNEDEVCGIIYNNTPYYFYKNQQGDIIEITDRNAAVVARYTYDAWGKVTAVKDANGTTITSTTHIANINPYRYRGYYYDVETKLYYLQSRYYDPEVGRFVNGDEPMFAVMCDTLTEHNLYTYCCNNPNSFIDSLGYMGYETAASKFIAKYGMKLAGASLNKIAKKLTAFLILKAPYLLGAALLIGALIVVYYAVKSKKGQKTKTLADVKVKEQSGKQYQVAYITQFGELKKVGKKLTFKEALIALGITGATNSLKKIYTLDKGKNSSAKKKVGDNENWGIYAHSQQAAKALAFVLGATKKPEVHASGMYGHYHDLTHTIHIWYGGKISY